MSIDNHWEKRNSLKIIKKSLNREESSRKGKSHIKMVKAWGVQILYGVGLTEIFDC